MTQEIQLVVSKRHNWLPRTRKIGEHFLYWKNNNDGMDIPRVPQGLHVDIYSDI